MTGLQDGHRSEDLQVLVDAALLTLDLIADGTDDDMRKVLFLRGIGQL